MRSHAQLGMYTVLPVGDAWVPVRVEITAVLVKDGGGFFVVRVSRNELPNNPTVTRTVIVSRSTPCLPPCYGGWKWQCKGKKAPRKHAPIRAR
jgi:hypothetical protein